MKIALIGNCQMRTYRKLIEASVPNAHVIALDFSDRTARQQTGTETFAQQCEDRDLVLTLPNTYLPTAELRARLGDDRVVCIGNFYFRGTFPDVCNVASIGGRIGWLGRNSVVVLGAYLAGMSVKDCLARFNAEEFEKLNLFNSWQTSLAQLLELDHNVDFPIGAFVERSVATAHCFRTLNHPTAHLLRLYLQHVADALGLGWQVEPLEGGDDPLRFSEYPVHDFVAERFGLPYRTGGVWRHQHRDVTHEQFVLMSYRHYDRAPRELLYIGSPSDMEDNVRNSTSELARHLKFNVSRGRKSPEAASRSLRPGGRAASPPSAFAGGSG